MFDGILGQFSMKLISLHIVEKESKLVHARPFSVPRPMKQTLRTEIAILMEIGLLEEDYAF
jgi:hypothetical protein